MRINRMIAAALIVVLTLCASAPAALAADDIEFSATLTTEGTWFPPGEIEFTVEIVNTGAADIDRFEFITPDAQLANEYSAIPAGQSASVPVVMIFDNPGEYPVELYVVGYSGSDSWTEHTNSVVVTVSNDPEPTPSPAPEATATPAPTPEPTAEATGEPTVEPTAEAQADAAGAAKDGNGMMYIIIAGLGVLVGAGIVVVIVIARKVKKTG